MLMISSLLVYQFSFCSLMTVPFRFLLVGESPGFAFSWLNEKNAFLAGDIATIMIKVLQNGNSSVDASQFMPVVTVNGKAGNSSYISGVAFVNDGTVDNWRIIFVPIMTGLFNVIVTEEQFKVLDSSLHFQVTPGKYYTLFHRVFRLLDPMLLTTLSCQLGPMYPSVSFVSWMGLVHEFDAGAKAALLVLLKDAFGNNITSSNKMLDLYNFTIPTFHGNGSLAVMQNISTVNWNEFGYIVIEFMAAMAGNFSLQVLIRGQNIDGSPLPYRVNPGDADLNMSWILHHFDCAWMMF